MFEGVINGADICKWLVQCQYKFAQDSAEACIIGQELVNSGLLHAVSCGFDMSHLYADTAYGYDSDEEQYDDVSKSVINSPKIEDILERPESGACFEVGPSSTVAMQFSTAPGYLYRYPSKSSTSDGVGSYSLLGAMVNVCINRWAKREATLAPISSVPTEKVSLRESLGMLMMAGGDAESERQLEANTEGQGYIHYEIVAKHHNDEWTVWRRYTEFEQFSKQLHKLGVRPSMGVSILKFYYGI